MTNFVQQSQPLPLDPLQSQAAVSNFATQSFGATVPPQPFGVTTGIQQPLFQTNVSQAQDFNTQQFGSTSVSQSQSQYAASSQQYATAQSLQQQFGPVTTSTEVQNIPVTTSTTVQNFETNFQPGVAQVAQSVPLPQTPFPPTQSTAIPQIVPKVTQTTIGKKATITAPVKNLGASTVQGPPTTSQTLPVTYSKPVTVRGKVLPPIHQPPKISQLPPQQQPGESRPPIFQKEVYKRNEINVNVARKTERLPEQHRRNEVQGETLAPINQKPLVLQQTQTVPVTRPPQYDKASVKVVDVPVDGGVLPQKFLNPRQMRPSYTNLPAAQRITRDPVVLKENVVNIAPLPPKFFPPKMLRATDLGYSKSVDNVFAASGLQQSALQGFGATGVSTVGGDVFATGAQGFGTTGISTVQGGDVFATQGTQGFGATGVSAVGGDSFATGAQGFGVTGASAVGGDAFATQNVQGFDATGAQSNSYQFSSGYQQSGATQYQTSSSYQVGPTTSYQQYFQSSSSSASPQVVTSVA